MLTFSCLVGHFSFRILAKIIGFILQLSKFCILINVSIEFPQCFYFLMHFYCIFLKLLHSFYNIYLHSPFYNNLYIFTVLLLMFLCSIFNCAILNLCIFSLSFHFDREVLKMAFLLKLAHKPLDKIKSGTEGNALNSGTVKDELKTVDELKKVTINI